MSINYIETPKYTTLNDIITKGYTLSATQYKALQIKNKSVYPLSYFLNRELKRKDLGSEVGSQCYINESQYKFIKTKALQENSYLIDITEESVESITPHNFRNMNLKAGEILISKDSNVGEVAILDKDYPNTMLCGGIYKLPINRYKYYLLAFIKHDIFRQQIDFLVPRGSTIRHGKTKFLDCMIPLPNKNKEKTIKYIEVLTEAIINKEIEIKKKFRYAMKLIEKELKINQNDKSFIYNLPDIKNIINLERLDSSLYSEKFKRNEFLINNYKYGSHNIKELGFAISRGQNLQISNIGHSIYSDKYKKDFYTLIKPTNISNYGTIIEYEYLGNANKMICLNKGDLVFGAEGTFRSFIVINDSVNTITNIHGITLRQKKHNIQKGIFIKLFLDYYRLKDMIKAYAVGGNGGSLAIKYWDMIKFPNFPERKEKEITLMYHNPYVEYNIASCTIDTFIEYNKEFDKKAGIYDIDISIKHLKEKLNRAIKKIINDEDIKSYF